MPGISENCEIPKYEPYNRKRLPALGAKSNRTEILGMKYQKIWVHRKGFYLVISENTQIKCPEIQNRDFLLHAKRPL